MSEYTEWLPIAHAFHKAPGTWIQIEGAPMSYQAARKAYDRGAILVANKRLEDRTLMVIKISKAQP